MTGTAPAATGTLYLIPTPIDEDAIGTLPPATLDVACRLRHFIAETPKHARQFLRKAGLTAPLQELSILTLDNNVPPDRVPELLAPLLAGHDTGLVSDAGCPGVADPGAALVRLAHDRGIRVVPLVGPSAILLALMASGMNGQQFEFCGYLPVEDAARANRLQQLERESRSSGVTRIFIETPYRNQRMLASILRHCDAKTMLSVATGLTGPGACIISQRVSAWRKAGVELPRVPAVFLLSAR